MDSFEGCTHLDTITNTVCLWKFSFHLLLEYVVGAVPYGKDNGICLDKMFLSFLFISKSVIFLFPLEVYSTTSVASSTLCFRRKQATSGLIAPCLAAYKATSHPTVPPPMMTTSLPSDAFPSRTSLAI